MFNWSDRPVAKLGVRFRAPAAVGRVTSARHGELKFEATAEGITFSLPLDDVDVIRVYTERK